MGMSPKIPLILAVCLLIVVFWNQHLRVQTQRAVRPMIFQSQMIEQQGQRMVTIPRPFPQSRLVLALEALNDTTAKIIAQNGGVVIDRRVKSTLFNWRERNLQVHTEMRIQVNNPHMGTATLPFVQKVYSDQDGIIVRFYLASPTDILREYEAVTYIRPTSDNSTSVQIDLSVVVKDNFPDFARAGAELEVAQFVARNLESAITEIEETLTRGPIIRR